MSKDGIYKRTTTETYEKANDDGTWILVSDQNRIEYVSLEAYRSDEVAAAFGVAASELNNEEQA